MNPKTPKAVKKIINTYYTNQIEEVGGHCSTGLIIELEDGTFLRHQSTDPVMTFEKFDFTPPKKQKGSKRT